MAKQADWGICLARTDPDAPKHDGISCFMVDMHTPGIDIRPLRELTGMAMFNEVFFDDVFVPDDCLVGAGERRVACAAHDARQRARLHGRQQHGRRRRDRACCARSKRTASPTITRALDEAGGLVATSHALAVLGFRLTLQALSGADPSGSEAAVRKLLGVEHDQHVQEVGFSLMGADAADRRGRGGRVGGVVPLQPLPHDRRRHQRHPAQRHRRTPARPAPRPLRRRTSATTVGRKAYGGARPGRSGTAEHRVRLVARDRGRSGLLWKRLGCRAPGSDRHRRGDRLEVPEPGRPDHGSTSSVSTSTTSTSATTATSMRWNCDAADALAAIRAAEPPRGLVDDAEFDELDAADRGAAGSGGGGERTSRRSRGRSTTSWPTSRLRRRR